MQDEISKEEIQTTLEVLEIMRDNVYNHENQRQNMCNEVHYLVQLYEQYHIEE